MGIMSALSHQAVGAERLLILLPSELSPPLRRDPMVTEVEIHGKWSTRESTALDLEA